MKQNIIIRKRKSAKHGATYEYRFETASIGGQRKWISKGGFLDENTTVPTRQSPHVYLTKEQLSTIFDRFPLGHPSYLPLMVGLHCGLRLGEAFALTWDDIDLENKKISVNKQIQWRQFKRTDEEKKNNNGRNTENCGCWYYSSTKYKSDRVLEMDEELYHLLSAEKVKQDNARAYFGDRFARYYETERREILVYHNTY